MKYFSALVFLSSLSQAAYSQVASAPIKINFQEFFKGKPDANSPFVALTALTWKYSYKAKIFKNGVTVKFLNEDILDKNRSWVRLNQLRGTSMMQQILNHEQGHVNISFIMVREADKGLSNQTYSKHNYKTEIAQLANSISDFYYTMQKNYDEETRHGSNIKMQARWDKIINERLEEALKK